MFSLLAALALTPVTSAATVNLGADAVAFQELFESKNAPADNDYGSPAAVTWSYDPLHPGATVATAYVRCGAWAAKGFVLGALLTEDELESLTGSESPEAAQWYDAIVASATVGAVKIDDVSFGDVQRGDILAAKYSNGTDTGHVMLVGQVIAVPATTPSWVVPLSPANATDNRTLVVIHDATKTPHGTTPNDRALQLGVRRDSRNEFTDTGGIEDKGVGVGTITVYTDATTGAITGWRWSHNGSYYPNDTTTSGRPIVAGRITEAI